MNMDTNAYKAQAGGAGGGGHSSNAGGDFNNGLSGVQAQVGKMDD